MKTETTHLVFIDAGLLVAAARGVDAIAERALAILSNPALRFASSRLVQLEVLPKAHHFGRNTEVSFYNAFFDKVAVWTPLNEATIEQALGEAIRHGLGAMDALHLVSAASVAAELFMMTERVSKPLHRTELIKVISIAL